MELFDKLVYWHWLVLSVVLIALEIFSPGVFMLWLGLAAAITGLVLLVIPDLMWQIQFLLFAIFSVVSILAARYWLKKHADDETDQPLLNRRGEQYVGRIFSLEEAIVNGQGKIRVDDTIWKAQGEDSEVGAQVKVTGVDGVVLLVERA